MAPSLPLVVGAYIGVRHFENEYQDDTKEDGVSTPLQDQLTLSNKVMSAIEPGIEIGVAF